MSIEEGERELENVDPRDKPIAWEKAAKGRGNRWRMMRDIVACLALRPMNLTQTQDAMMRLRGLSRNKVIEMMSQLESAGDLKPTSGRISGVEIAGTTATDRGVHFWLDGSRGNIPASIVRVLPIMVSVPDSEAKEVVHDG